MCVVGGGGGGEGVVIAGKRNSQNNIYIYVFLSYKFLLRFSTFRFSYCLPSFVGGKTCTERKICSFIDCQLFIVREHSHLELLG